MLPFLKPKKQATTVIVNSDAQPKEDAPDGLVAISEQLISAIHAKDATALASALQELLKDEPEAE